MTLDPEKKQKTVYKIVLTGGPCSGKTTGQVRLSTFFENLGWKVYRVPEAATTLLSGGVRFPDLSPAEAEKFQENLLKTMMAMEETYFALAATCDRNCLVICDRGTMDAAAYLPEQIKHVPAVCLQLHEHNRRRSYHSMGKCLDEVCPACPAVPHTQCCCNHLDLFQQIKMDYSLNPRTIHITFYFSDEDFVAVVIPKDAWEKLLSSNGWNPVQLRDNRYNQVVHLITAANGAEAFYNTEDNSCRTEGLELARERDRRAAEAWVGHPYIDVIDNSTDFDTKLRRLIASVCTRIGIDTGDRLATNSHKLKFLIGILPPDMAFPPYQDFEVVHDYLVTSNPKVQARLRKRGQNGKWTYMHTQRRCEVNNQVIELKRQITHRDYINMLAQRDDTHYKVYKIRRCFMVNNLYMQMDIYKSPCHPRCNGLILLETYTTLKGEELMSRLPSFLDVKKEVTGDPSYSMFNLSLKGDWNPSKLVAMNNCSDGSYKTIVCS